MIRKNLLIEDKFIVCSIPARYLVTYLLLHKNAIEYREKTILDTVFPCDKDMSTDDICLILNELLGNGILSIINVNSVEYLTISNDEIDNKKYDHNYSEDIPKEWLLAANDLNNPNIKDIHHVYNKYINYNRNRGNKISIVSWIGWCRRERQENQIEKVCDYESKFTKGSSDFKPKVLTRNKKNKTNIINFGEYKSIT